MLRGEFLHRPEQEFLQRLTVAHIKPAGRNNRTAVIDSTAHHVQVVAVRVVLNFQYHILLGWFRFIPQHDEIQFSGNRTGHLQLVDIFLIGKIRSMEIEKESPDCRIGRRRILYRAGCIIIDTCTAARCGHPKLFQTRFARW